MGYSEENGYIPLDIDAIMLSIMNNINTQFGTSYTADTFEGTNFYKYFYALAQRLQENEVKTSEIFSSLQDYFEVINAQISRPIVTNPGIVEALETAGYIASVKPMIDADAGLIHICVDADDGVQAEGNITITNFANLVSGTDDSVGIAGTTFTAQAGAATLGTATFQAATDNAATAASLALQINSHATVSLLVRAVAIGAVVEITAKHGGVVGNAIALAYTDNDTNVGATKSGTTLADGEDNAEYEDIKLALCTLISGMAVGGAVTQGTESEAIVLSNGQSFDFKYNLPDRIPIWLRLTIATSENNQVLIDSQDEIKAALVENIEARYRLGRNFEPQRYFSVVDAPWAASVLLEYSLNYDSIAETGTFYSVVYEAEYDDLFEVALDRILLVET